MSKYLDADNPVDMAAVEENYRNYVAEAELRARQDADELLEEIRFYRANSFEEIAKYKFENYVYTNALLSPEEYYNKEGKNIIEYYAMRKIAKKKKIKRSFSMSDENDRKKYEEYMSSLSEDEKRAIVEQERKKRIKETETRVKDWRKKDLLYDMMTEEQIQKYVELFYICSLKDHLVEGKYNSISNARNLKNKRNSDKTYSSLTQLKRIATVKALEPDDEMVKEEKAKTREYIKDYIKMQGGISLGLGAIVPTLELILDGTIGPEALAIGGFFTGLGVVVSGATSIGDIIIDKKCMKEAKKFGLYDLIVEYLKATKQFEEYKEELEEDYLPDDLEKILEDAVKETSELDSKEVSL